MEEKREPYDPEKHGISYSTLSDWLTCRQIALFRAKGVKSKIPSYPLTFGNIGHDVLKSAHIGVATGKITKLPGPKRVAKWVAHAETEWRKQNPHASVKALEKLDLACALAEVTMTEYFKYYRKSFLTTRWDDKLTERLHKIPFKVTGYTSININVVMDSSYWLSKTIKSGKNKGKKVDRLWLFETKTSSRIVEQDLIDTIPLGLQHGIYMIALEHLYGKLPRGVMYNFIRRSSMYQRNNENSRDFAQRVLEDIRKRPDYYFVRIEMVTDRDEVRRVKAELQGLIHEYIQWYKGKTIHYRTTSACLGKFGRCQYLPICSEGDYTFFEGGPVDERRVRPVS